MTKKELLDRIARSGEERILLARVLDKLDLAQNRGIPSCTAFLSPGEQASVSDLLNAWGHPRHLFWGGYEDSERRICLFPPDWQEESDFCSDPAGPLPGGGFAGGRTYPAVPVGERRSLEGISSGDPAGAISPKARSDQNHP